MAVTGEIPFFESDRRYKMGIKSYIMKMPAAAEDQLTLAKSPAVWYQNDVIKVLKRHKGNFWSQKSKNHQFISEHLPNLKILLIVKDPIGKNKWCDIWKIIFPFSWKWG